MEGSVPPVASPAGQAEEPYPERLALLDAADACAPVGTAVLDRDGRFVRANRVFGRVAGFEPGECLGKRAEELFGGDGPLQVAAFERVLAGETVTTRHQAARPAGDGRWLAWETVHYPIWLGGSVAGIGLTLVEVSPGARAAAADAGGERAAAELRRHLDAMPVLVGIHRPGAVPVYYNAAWQRYTGMTYEEIRAGGLEGRYHPDDVPGIQTVVAEQAVARSEWALEARIRRADGTYRWHIVRGAPVAGSPERLAVITAMDIHDRKQAEEAREQTAQFQRKLGDALPVLVSVSDQARTAVYLNRQWSDYTGRPEAELMDTVKRSEVYHPDDRTAGAVFREWRPEAGAVSAEVRIRRHDGVYRWHQLRAVPVVVAGADVPMWVTVAIDIDDRKTAEAALTESEARYRAVAQTAPVNVLLMAPDGTPRYANEHWLAYSGVTVETGPDWGPMGVVHPDDRPRVRAEYEAFFSDDQPFETELRMRRADGAYRWHAARGALIRDAAGQVTGLLISSWDIHDHQQAEERARANEQALQSMMDALPVLVSMTGAQGEVVRHNRSWEMYTGRGHDELVDAEQRRDLYGPDLAKAYAIRDRLLAGETVDSEELRIRDRDGVLRWHLVRTTRVPGAGDAPMLNVTVCTDIHDRKVAEEALATAERRHRQILDAVPATVMVTDAAGNLTYANRFWSEYSGLPLDATASWASGGTMHPDELPAMVEKWAEALAKRSVFEHSYRVRRADGAYRWSLSRSVPMLDEADELVGWAGTTIDIHDRVLAEQALAASEARYRTLVEAIPASVSLLDAEGRVTYRNSHLRRFLGLGEADSEAGAWAERSHPDDGERLAAAWEAARTAGRPVHMEVRLRKADGAYCWQLLATVPIAGEDGTVGRWLSVAVDIDEVKQAEAALRRANELKDEFLGLVSHELRTPLTGILGNAQVLLRHGDSVGEEQRRASLEDVRTEAERLQRLVENMLVLAGIEARALVNAEPVLLRRLLPRVVAARQAQDPGRPLRLQLADGLPPVRAEPTYVDQVLGNLLSNAAKYSPPGAPIEVTARATGRFVEVRVRDYGVGLPPEELDAVFQPFFRSGRTAASAPGAGLGLAVCRRLVEAQGGATWAEPPADGGSGAEFVFTLPVEDAAG
ncbi:MAG: PAS domain S-box protein [Dehalococcoidia bacterium]|nr:PAS domain S-box protein [Dehalococcoidia bacterium]